MAAVGSVSCQRAQDSAQSTGAAESQTSSGSEAEIAPDTVFWVQLQKDLDSSKLKTGDHFSGEIAEDVLVGGKALVPKGSTVSGRVTNSTVAQGQGSAGLLSLVLDSVRVKGSSYKLETKPVTLEGTALQQPDAGDSKVAKDVKSAYVPKKGILQFFLANAVRVKS